jgi:hypothetical protein
MNEVKRVVQNQIKNRVKQKNEAKTFIGSLLGSKKEGISPDTKAALELDARYALKRFLKVQDKK